MTTPVGVAVVGFGYWGPKLIRNFNNADSTRPVAICERDEERRQKAARAHPGLKVVASLEEVLADEGVEAVAIATPVSTHYELARAALAAGKHLFVTKPFTRTSAEAVDLIALARQKQRLILVDHTFVFTPAVQKLRHLVRDETLGELLYYDSIRINLGLFQPDVDVIWDLAPHDFSILDFVLPGRPHRVAAVGASHSPTGHNDIAYVTADFGNGLLAHLHLNWLAPLKVRQILIGGSKRMVLFNDIVPDEKIRIYDRGIDIAPGSRGHTITADDPEGRYQTMISYRTGDMYAPWLDRTEALFSECLAFGRAVRAGVLEVNDALSGLRVVLMLEAASRSLRQGGGFADVDWTALDSL